MASGVRPAAPATPRLAVAALALAAGFSLVLLLASVFGPYGWFIDELYYLACAKRLAWGYVDHPPLSIAVLALVRGLAGDATWAVRLPAALATGATALIAALLARQWGGGTFAQTLAALCVCASPAAMILGSFFSMNAFELLLWPAAALLLVRLLDSDEPRWWLPFGLLMGLGLLNKHTTVLFLGAVGAALLLVPARRHLLTPWPWLGALAVLAMIAPNLAWQHANGWPSLEFYQNAQRLKNIPTPLLKVFADQVLFAGPGSLPVWLAGLAFLLRDPAARRFRLLGYAFLPLLGLMLVSGSSRPDRIGAFYPILFAAGAVAISAWSQRPGRGWLRPFALVLVAGSGLFLAPITLPLLPPERVAAYAQATGILPRLERGKTSPIPQWLADRTGWPEFVADVEGAFTSLPAEDRSRAILYAPSYGQAGALELLGPEHGLPSTVICNHNTYHLWSAGHTDSDVLVAAGAREKDLVRLFRDVREVRVHRCQYCMSWRNEMPIFVARGAREPLSRYWPELRHFE
ncbi:MAG TPA: glycosyltransferase family 39 protein [Vicinamibacteria bacterium]